MKKFNFRLLAMMFALLPYRAFAAEAKILFFYPGGQGDQQSAQPILDAFADALKRNSGGAIDAKVFYLSDMAQGKQFIHNEKPVAAILSLDVFLSQGPAWGAKLIAKTLQLPSGDGTDQYYIMGKKGAALPASGALTLVSPRAIDAGFVSGKLFPQLKAVTLSVQPSENTVGTLRDIGGGKREGFVLLDRFEYSNVSKLKTPWASELAVIAESSKVSSAPFVVFPANATPETLKALESALLKLGGDSAAKETLGTLRLKGFQAATQVD